MFVFADAYPSYYKRCLTSQNVIGIQDSPQLQIACSKQQRGEHHYKR